MKLPAASPSDLKLAKPYLFSYLGLNSPDKLNSCATSGIANSVERINNKNCFFMTLLFI